MFKRLFFFQRTPPFVLPQDQEALIEIARTDSDPGHRQDACRRIIQLSALRALAEEDPSASVRELARARHRKLICGLIQPAPNEEESLAEVQTIDSQALLEQIATNAQSSKVRLAAIRKLQRSAVLVTCALEDPVAANRWAAVECLQDKQGLEQVLRQIGKRDKRVHRLARSKLRAIAEAEALPKRIRQECEALCETLESLGRFDQWAQDYGRFALIERRWSELASQVEAHLQARYEQGRARFLQAYEAYQREHAAQLAEEAARAANRKERESLIDKLRQAQGERAHLEEIRREAVARWESLAPLPEAQGQPLTEAYEVALQALDQRIETLRIQQEAKDRLAQCSEAAQRLLEAHQPVDRKQIRAIYQELQTLQGVPGLNPLALKALEETHQALQARLQKQVQQVKQRLAQVPAQLAELQEALEAGELKRAEALFQRLKDCAEKAEKSGLPAKQFRSLREQLKTLAPQVRELQQWRRWSTDSRRTELCQAMESLVDAALSEEARALQLQALQSEWKRLDRAGSPNQALWERFQQASEQVYARCKPYFERLAAEREAARQAREALCQELEDFLAQVDWEQVDWKKLQQAERDMRRRWEELGETEGRHRRALEKRFRKAMKRLDDQLKAERDRNRAWRLKLIEQVEKLREAPNLEDAIETCKRLQRQWHTTVPCRKKEENQLWHRFRTACDAVFARRRQRYEAQRAEEQENLALRESLCAEVERLAAEETDLETLEDRWRALEARWEETQELPLPKGTARTLNQRWKEAVQRLERQKQRCWIALRQGTLEALASRAALCEQLERGSDAAQAQEIQAAWENLPPLEDLRLQNAMEARFQRALEGLPQGPSALLEENRRKRAEICLQLEILAGIDSPPECARERLAFQVNRLQHHMGAGERDALEAADRLLEAWYLCGPVPAEEAESLEARFQRAKAALAQAQQKTSDTS